ncbi:MAG: hypothetical protein K6G56_06935 [Clostridiales bacterium]|nr:hypothetical protein [Clostridiales bacterium]
MKKLAAIIIAVCMLALVPVTNAETRAQIGTSVGGFSSELLDGTPIDGSVFASYSVSAVTYWATWSADCREQLVILQSIHEAHPEYGLFGLLYTDGTSTASAAQAFLSEQGIDIPVFLCDEVWQGVVNESMIIPQTFIVNRNGMIVESWQAAFDNAGILEERLAVWAEVLPAADGDANLDGEVTSGDALYVIRCVMRLITPGAENTAHGDLNGNGVLDNADALMIIRRVMGLKGA